MLLDNSYALKEHELKCKVDASINLIEDKIVDIEKMIDIFRDFSRRKAFVER
jgi:hypothetical protein